MGVHPTKKCAQLLAGVDVEGTAFSWAWRAGGTVQEEQGRLIAEAISAVIMNPTRGLTPEQKQADRDPLRAALSKLAAQSPVARIPLLQVPGGQPALPRCAQVGVWVHPCRLA